MDSQSVSHLLPLLVQVQTTWAEQVGTTKLSFNQSCYKPGDELIVSVRDGLGGGQADPEWRLVPTHRCSGRHRRILAKARGFRRLYGRATG